MTFEKTTTMEQKIIQAARETFLKKGYKETNMSDIAAAVGLTRPAMHYYFRTKERLFQTNHQSQHPVWRRMAASGRNSCISSERSEECHFAPAFRMHS